MERKVNVKLIKAEGKGMITKALESKDKSDTKETDLSGQHNKLPRPYPIAELQLLVEKSTILQQCIDAYKRNIVGFGAAPKYLNDDVADNETSEMEREWDIVKGFIRYFHFDKSFEDVLSETIEDRETTGNGYLEVLRDGKGMPVEGDRINPDTMWITKLSDPVSVKVVRDGKTFERRKRFRKYIQEIGQSKTFFKEFGDPRKMDSRTGNYVESIEEQYEATEIIHFKIGLQPYGVPRWIGQLIHMYGARKAEELNFRYFTQGRHTPMAILLHNAVLSAESEQALLEYAQSVEGSDNAHKFLLIEAEGLAEGMLDEEKQNAKVEVKSLADMLQQDALFLEYDDASRLKVQSAFRLPDIYVGRSKDYNRATADIARSITEEQVFEPERNSLEWIINNKLLMDYLLQETGVMFNKPEISNVEDVVNIIKAANEVGAIAPNDIREIVGKYLGKNLENFEGEEYDLPISSKVAQPSPEQPEEEEPEVPIQKQLSDDIVLLLKDVRDVLDEQTEVIQKVYDNERL